MARAAAPERRAKRAALRASVALLASLVACPAGAQDAEVPAESSVVPDARDGSQARALAPPFAAPTAPRVAVLLFSAGSDLDSAMVDALTELLIAAVAARGERVQIVGKEELQAQLGHDDAGTARCLESAACLGRVGVELEVREIISGVIAHRQGAIAGDDVWTFDLHRLDVRGDAPLGRVFREVRGGLDALFHALETSIPELYARRVRPGRLVLRASENGAEMELDGAAIGRFAGEPLRRETVEPGTHVLRVRAPGHRLFERTIEVEEGATLMIDAVLERAGSWQPSPLVWVGGAGALATLVTGIALGVASQTEPDVALSMRETVDEFYPAREREAIAANVMFGLAVAGAAVMAVGLALSGADEAPREHAWVAPSEHGATAGVAGRF